MRVFNNNDEVRFSELVGDGYIVAIEGDNDFYGYDGLKEALKNTYKENFLFFGNIYNSPGTLKMLKDIKVDVFIYQTTGIRHEQLKMLQEFYMENIKTVPKNIISLFYNDIYRFSNAFDNVNFFTMERYESEKTKYEEIILDYEFTSNFKIK